MKKLLWSMGPPCPGSGTGAQAGGSPSPRASDSSMGRQRLGQDAGPWVRFRIRLGNVNWSQTLLWDGWAWPWGWSGTSASSACFLCGV